VLALYIVVVVVLVIVSLVGLNFKWNHRLASYSMWHIVGDTEWRK